MSNPVGDPYAATSATAPNEEPENQMVWWARWLIKALVILAAVGAIILAGLSIISVNPLCIIASILMILSGVVIIAFELPMCCQCIGWLNMVQIFIAKRPKWQKAVLYAALGIIPVIMCQGLTLIFGCVCILVCAILYGVLAVGRKSNRDQMLNAVQQPQEANIAANDKAGLVKNDAYGAV